MTVIPFIGPSYVYRSLNYDAQRSVNLYPVKSETGDSKAISALVGTPGLELFLEFPTLPMRQIYNANGRSFAVSGGIFYEIFSDGTYLSRGQLLTLNGYVQMADNGTQVCVVDGQNGYIFTISNNNFQRITSEGWRGSDTVAYIDGYFLFNDPGTGVYYISAINDGSDIDALDFASAEGSPDNLTGLAAVHREAWLFGINSIEVAFDSGDPDFPFQRIQGAFIQYGCGAVGSIAVNANTVFWLGQDAQGAGVVWMATGYQPQRISTNAVEYAIQQYADLSSCTSYCYQEDGHYFYVLNFAEGTWVYDVGMNQWHERARWNSETGQYERHVAQCHIYSFGIHLVGDYRNGKLYRTSLDIYDDDGEELRAMRQSPHIADDLEYIYFNKFQLDMQMGVGLDGDAPSQDVTPMIMLQWSDDGGYTYSSEHWVEAGKIGHYNARALWRRLGRSRDRIWRVVFTAACKRFWIAAHVDMERGTN